MDVHVFRVRKQEDLMYLTHFEVPEVSALSSSQTIRPNGETSLSTERPVDVVVGTPPYRRRELLILDPFRGTGRILLDTSAVIHISLHAHCIYSLEW